MTGVKNMAFGDFTALADKYAAYRPGYAPMVLDAFLALLPKEREIADVGAGTGLWSRMLAERGVQVTAVEPNDAMREAGIKQNGTLPITWLKGSAEITNLPTNSFDAVCMASSFHWANFDTAIEEFCRILRPGGIFMALWNPRKYESNPVLLDIEETLKELVPNLNRVSSGRSEFCANLFDRFASHPSFEDVLYIEGRHVEQQSHERYIGLWESVNDIRVQAGEAVFSQFLDTISEKIAPLPHIDAEYTTRAWIAKRRC